MSLHATENRGEMIEGPQYRSVPPNIHQELETWLRHLTGKYSEVSDVFVVPAAHFASCECPFFHVVVHLDRGLNEDDSLVLANRMLSDPEVRPERVDWIVVPNLCADDPDVDLDDSAQRSGCKAYSLNSEDPLPADAAQVGVNQEYCVYHRHR
jgi:hypothetical protein